MDMGELKIQIRTSINKYNEKIGKKDPEIECAFLSGMSLVANFFSKLEGSKTITPQMFLKAVSEVGTEKKLGIERL